ncbi:MAG: AMP-binding protein [Alkalilacustris sp.]
MAEGAGFRDIEPVGVVAEGGCGYVEAMLDQLQDEVVTVPLRSAADADRIARAGVGRVITPVARHGWLDRSFVSRPGRTPAMISFSSGTEGAPKAVLLARSNLHDVVERLTEAMQITAEIREYVGVPVHHSFGYGRCRTVLHAGGALYLPERGFDLAELRAMLAAGEVNAVSAVPSQWRVVLQNLDLFGSELAALRWAEIGSQYMSANEKRRLREALPQARIVQHYGLTEASRATLLRVHDEPAERLEAVGRAEGRTSVRINARGRIELCGPHVALAIDDGTTTRWLEEGAWLETGDTGRLDGGLLYFTGRDDDVINCSGIKLSPEMAETHVRASVPVQGDFGVLRTPDPLRGEGILVALTVQAAAQRDAVLDAVRTYARGLGLDPGGSLRAVIVDELPRTATGKLQRRALADRLMGAPTAPQTDGAPPAPPSEASLAQVIDALVGPGASASPRSFLEHEGDSLTHMQLALGLERVYGTPPDGWEALPLADLVARAPVTPATRQHRGARPLPRGDRNMNPPELSFWALVREDFCTNDSSLVHQGFLMLLVHRFGNWRMGVRSRILRAPLTVLYRVLNKMTQILFGMKLDYTVQVGRRVKLEHFGGMILGARSIGNDVILRQNTTLGIRSTDDLHAKPVIGDFVDVGAGAVIVGDITVGENSIVGANSVVYTNVPPGSVVVGVPGRVIGRNPRRNPSPLAVRAGSRPASEAHR